MNMVSAEIDMTRKFPGTGVSIRLQSVQTERDLELIWSWLQKDHVREYWDMGSERANVREYLNQKLNSGYLKPLLIHINGQVAGYTELYDYNQDPLANFYPGEEFDQGWHVFLGEEKFIGAGSAIYVGHAVIETLFTDERVQRIICEPDLRNLRMINFVKKLSFRPICEIELPDKTALYMECRRENYNKEPFYE